MKALLNWKFWEDFAFWAVNCFTLIYIAFLGLVWKKIPKYNLLENKKMVKTKCKRFLMAIAVSRGVLLSMNVN